jgi:branched-chain amino acid transport system ATP-binding protein
MKVGGLINEHDVQIMMDTCDFVFAMNFGALIAQGTPAEVVRDPGVQRPISGGSGDSMLEIRDLYVNYDKASVVRGVSLTVSPGRITLLLGANGAGKTTTLRAIAGLHRPHSGEVLLDDKRITGLAADKVVRFGSGGPDELVRAACVPRRGCARES